MRSTKTIWLIISVCLAAASLLFASKAPAATSEYECIEGGGHVSEGSGCKFCIGGKFDLSEVNDSRKSKTSSIKSEQKPGVKEAVQSAGDTPAKNNR